MSAFIKKTHFVPCFVILSMMIMGCHPSNYMFEQFAQEETGWVQLGEKKVNHLREKDVLKIKGIDKYTALRFYISDRDVTITDLEIHLINGDVLKPAIENEVKRGERSRIVELASDGRQLDHISFRYSSAGALFTKRGRLLIVGRKYNPNAAY